MKDFICERCGKPFKAYYKDRKYCSKDCAYNSFKGERRGPYKEDRVELMRVARENAYIDRKLVPLKSQIREVLLQQYVSSIDSLRQKISENPRDISIGALKTFIGRDENLDFLLKNTPIYPRSLQKMGIEDFKKVKYLVEQNELMPLEIWERFQGEERYSKNTLSKAGLKALYKELLSKDIFCKHEGTYPERLFKRILKKYRIPYEFQVKINTSNTSYFIVDFIVDNAFYVEINGDYWHANPDIYNESSLNAIQWSVKARDAAKYAFFKETSKDFMVIWENDLKKRFETIEKEILDKWKETVQSQECLKKPLA